MQSPAVCNLDRPVLNKYLTNGINSRGTLRFYLLFGLEDKLLINGQSLRSMNPNLAAAIRLFHMKKGKS